MIFRLDNGKNIFLYRENIVNDIKPIRNNKVILLTVDDRFVIHLSEIFNYVYDFCLHKITDIICYENRKMKITIWETKYEENKKIIINGKKLEKN